MPVKRSSRAEVNTFVQGIITEASPLNFPENASSDEENFILNRDGTRERRKGMDVESVNYKLLADSPFSQVSTVGISTFTWTQVKGSSYIELLVIQIGQLLSFYDNSAPTLSETGYKGFLRIDRFPTTKVYSFASVEGFLVVAAGEGDFAVIEYDDITNAITISFDRIRIRDLFGVQSPVSQYELDSSFRGGLEPMHYYNLQNQSWGIPRRDAAGAGRDPILNYEEALLRAPSNSEQVWVGMQFQPAQPPAGPFERMYVNLYDEVIGSTTTSPKGYFIIDALNRGASRAFEFSNNRTKYPGLGYYSSGLLSPYTNPPFKQDSTTSGATCITSFSGRIFYSGFSGTVVDPDSRSPNYGNFVFYSQLIKNRTDFNKCYQEGDPTSREGSDVVDTDGGFLKISGANNILALVPLATSLVVLAENGVWTVTGGSDYGFTGTNQKVNKISSYGGSNAQSVVIDGDKMFYWSKEGIFVLGRNEFGDFSVESMTLKTIQSLYDSFSTYAKENAYGLYDTDDKKVKWLFRDSPVFTPGVYTKELVFDTTIGAFSVNRIMNTEMYKHSVAGIFKTQNKTMYLVLENGAPNLYFTFGEYKNESFIDWESEDGVGVDAKAYLYTGYQTAGDSAVDKQMPYIVMHFRKTETQLDMSSLKPTKPSGCLMQCRWDFTNGSQSNKWSPLQQVYRDRRMFYPDSSGSIDNGYELVTSKTKVRGKGKAFSMYLETEPSKDCKIIGWNITINGHSIA